MTAPPPWRQNLFAVTSATFVGFTGFTLVMPFLPLYFRELGVVDTGRIALWSGLSLGVTPALTALLAPWWGRLADRFGRKIMVERSLFSFVVVMAATAYVTEAWHVFALRTIQGFFAGYGALALTMAAESAPAGKRALAIGTVQTAQRLGPALGPVLGGTAAQLVGLRRAFLVAACFYVVGFLIVLAFYREGERRSVAATASRETRVTFRSVLAFRHFLLLMAVIFGLQFVDRSFGPILPLFLVELGVPSARVPLLSGLLFSIAAGAGAVGNLLCGRLLARLSAHTAIIGSAIVGGVGALVFAAEPSVLVLVVASIAFGLAVGVGMTAAYPAGSSVVPAAATATGFGFLTSASLAGLALSPILSGLLAAASIRAVFVADAVGLFALAGWVWHAARAGEGQGAAGRAEGRST